MINDPWLKTSIMAKRGVAKGQAGQRHQLSIAAQGDFHYAGEPQIIYYDPNNARNFPHFSLI